jgi:hypothetical protein
MRRSHGAAALALGCDSLHLSERAVLPCAQIQAPAPARVQVWVAHYALMRVYRLDAARTLALAGEPAAP